MTQTDDRTVGAEVARRSASLTKPVRPAEPVDAELVNAAEGPQLPARTSRTKVDILSVRPLVGGRSAKELVRSAPRSAARTGYTAAQGGASWAKRVWNAATHGYIREQIRLARAAGDKEALAEWTDRLEDAKDKRLKRVLAAPKAALSGAAVFGVVLVVALFLAFLGGVAAWLIPDDGMGWNDWWAGVGGLIGGAWAVVRWTFWLAAVGVLPLLVFLSVREGKRMGAAPMWLLSAPERAVVNAEITPSKVVVALRDLGIPKLRTAIQGMDDGGAAMLSPITIAGCGVEVDILLPSGVSTDDIQKRRRRFAENLNRHEYELHLSVTIARTVRAWIADSGALDEPIGPSPLVLDAAPAADIYNGRAPWGVDLRGDAVALSLLQRHVLVTGLSNQGKTASARALVLWAIFDVVAEFRLCDLKGLGDWNMFKPIATELIQGPADEHVMAGTEMLEAGVEEMERRLQALDKDKYPDGVTRQLARQKGSGFHPIVLVVDEAQVAFMCPALDEQGRPYGGTKANSRFFNAARKLLNQGRAVNVTLWMFTQDPTNQNLPKLIREAFHIRCCLVVGTPEQSRMAVGDKAVDGGAAPHLLRQGIDKGVLVIAGDGAPLAPGQASITVRTHFLNGTDATALVARAVEARRKRGRHLAPVPAVTRVDHLENVARALGDEQRMRTPVLLGELIALDEDTYTEWGFQDLKAALEEEGVPIAKVRGDSVVRLNDVQKALEARLEETL